MRNKLPLLICALLSSAWLAAASPNKTENVFLITIDGLRWQEVFSGAEALLMNREHGSVKDSNRLRNAF